ncbi:hypothetical protein ACH5RR_026045 [Cinchona calisaya]|uniref:Uncharacterized protein n=1 Tax=Cinchona calisaya TaxID=153742 RepID=A0ABD2Z1E2_9GENT
MGPLIRLSHVCNADEKPSTDYVYEVEEEPIGELDYEELEAKLEELPVDDDVECSNSQQVEDVDLESFQLRGTGFIDEDDEWLT